MIANGKLSLRGMNSIIAPSHNHTNQSEPLLKVEDTINYYDRQSQLTKID